MCSSKCATNSKSIVHANSDTNFAAKYEPKYPSLRFPHSFSDYSPVNTAYPRTFTPTIRKPKCDSNNSANYFSIFGAFVDTFECTDSSPEYYSIESAFNITLYNTLYSSNSVADTSSDQCTNVSTFLNPISKSVDFTERISNYITFETTYHLS